jgi:hypothetical protein
LSQRVYLKSEFFCKRFLGELCAYYKSIGKKR